MLFCLSRCVYSDVSMEWNGMVGRRESVTVHHSHFCCFYSAQICYPNATRCRPSLFYKYNTNERNSMLHTNHFLPDRTTKRIPFNHEETKIFTKNFYILLAWLDSSSRLDLLFLLSAFCYFQIVYVNWMVIASKQIVSGRCVESYRFRPLHKTKSKKEKKQQKYFQSFKWTHTFKRLNFLCSCECVRASLPILAADSDSFMP